MPMASHKPEHAMLKAGWVAPSMPDGYDARVVVMSHRGGHCELDYFKRAGAMLASEDASAWEMPLPSWPWIDGYEPTQGDWRLIGFEIL